MLIIQKKIPKQPNGKLYYLIDTNFLVNKHLNPRNIQDKGEINRIKAAKEYWKIIDQQLDDNIAQVYILDVCIAETFKVFAKKYYNHEPIFKSHSSYAHVCSKVRKDITLSPKEARKSNRNIKYHDLQTNRDIIIGVDRFFENINRKKLKKLGIVDVMILSAARYLIDYYGIDKNSLAIITQDAALYKLASSYSNLPPAFIPHRQKYSSKKVFVG
jgi:hypothetical protein